MLQKREYKRFNLDGEVELKTENGRDRILRVNLDDIGLGGIRMYSQEKIEVNKNIGFTIMTPSFDRPLMGRGKIRHINTMRRYGTNFFLMGVQFTRINKNKVKHLLYKALGWRKRTFLSRQHRRELFLLLKLLPLMILLMWPILKATSVSSYYNNKEQQYRKNFKEAVIYYLYHS